MSSYDYVVLKNLYCQETGENMPLCACVRHLSGVHGIGVAVDGEFVCQPYLSQILSYVMWLEYRVASQVRENCQNSKAVL